MINLVFWLEYTGDNFYFCFEWCVLGIISRDVVMKFKKDY